MQKEQPLTKEIKAVLDRNGYRRARLDDISEDYDSRIVTLSVPVEDYQYLRDNIGSGDEHIKGIFADALAHSSLPAGYNVLAVFKDSFGQEVSN